MEGSYVHASPSPPAFNGSSNPATEDSKLHHAPPSPSPCGKLTSPGAEGFGPCRVSQPSAAPCRCGSGLPTKACGICMSPPTELARRVARSLPPRGAGAGPGGEPPASAAGPAALLSSPTPDQSQPTLGSSFQQWPPTPEESFAIDLALYGPSKGRRRLPVFEAICPSDDR